MPKEKNLPELYESALEEESKETFEYEDVMVLLITRLERQLTNESAGDITSSRRI